jgi:histone deacetylase 11
MDVYNSDIYPGDDVARPAIDIELRVGCGIGDERYLRVVRRGLKLAGQIHRNTPVQFVLYNAGTDILDGDPLGRMCVSGEGIRQRDQLVFEFCLSRKIPVCMVLSGGYQPASAGVIAGSIRNLFATCDLKRVCGVHHRTE